MILASGVFSTTALTLAALALVAYGLAALPLGRDARWPSAALAVGVCAHALWLTLDIGSVGSDRAGVRLGFAPVASLTVCLILIVHTIESRFVQLPSVRRALGLAGAISVALAVAFPGEGRARGAQGRAVLQGRVHVARSSRRLGRTRSAKHCAKGGTSGMAANHIEAIMPADVLPTDIA